MVNNMFWIFKKKPELVTQKELPKLLPLEPLREVKHSEIKWKLQVGEYYYVFNDRAVAEETLTTVVKIINSLDKTKLILIRDMYGIDAVKLEEAKSITVHPVKFSTFYVDGVEIECKCVRIDSNHVYRDTNDETSNSTSN